MNPTSDNFIKLGSLLLIAPIAFFVSKELERRQRLSNKIEAKTDEIIQDATSIKESGTASNDETEAIDEIIEEAESLKSDNRK